MKILTPLLAVLLIFGVTSVSVRAMEKNNNPSSLHWYFERFGNEIIFTPEEEKIFQAEYAHTNKRILSCTTEQQVLREILKDLEKSYKDLLHFLKIKRYAFPISKNGAPFSYMPTFARLEQINKFYGEGCYNLFKESPAIQTDPNTVFWKNSIWKNAVLVPNEKLDFLYAATEYFNINKFFMTVLSKSDSIGSITFNDPSTYILPEDYGFILHISHDTAKKLTVNPLLCLPIFLSHITRLIKGYGLQKTVLYNGLQYRVLDSGNLFEEPTCNSILKNKATTWQKAITLFSDIAAIICPSENQQFSKDERAILYKLSLKFLIEKMNAGRKSENDSYDSFSMTRLGVLYYLYTLTK